MDANLQWEIEWIQANVERYDSPLHARSVIGNITKRYAAAEVARLVANYGESRTTGDQLKLLEHFELTSDGG